MTEQEALRECERLTREHPDRQRASWLPRRDESGEWTVVRVNAPGLRRRPGAVRPEIQPPPQRPDPAQDVPQEPRPWWGT